MRCPSVQFSNEQEEAHSHAHTDVDDCTSVGKNEMPP